MGFDKYEGICRYSESVICEKMDCGNCGWNPVISEKRLEEFRKRNGVKKRQQKVRPINAISTAARIETVITPMVEKGFSQHRILAEVMKCISASRTVNAKMVVFCCECKHTEETNTTSKKTGTLVCRNKQSPCNRRIVNDDFYCMYGERNTYGKEND